LPARMKTTIELEDSLLAEVKRRAAAEGKTMKAFLEEALLARLRPRPRDRTAYRVDLPVVKGVRPPAIDIADRRVLYDFMDENE